MRSLTCAALILLAGLTIADDKADFTELLREFAAKRNVQFEAVIESRMEDESGYQYSATLQGHFADPTKYRIRFATLWDGGWMAIADGSQAMYDPLDDLRPGQLYNTAVGPNQFTNFTNGGPLVTLFSGEAFYETQAAPEASVEIERSADDTEWTVTLGIGEPNHMTMWFIRENSEWQPTKIEVSVLEGSGFRRITSYEIISWGQMTPDVANSNLFDIEAILRSVRWTPERVGI